MGVSFIFVLGRTQFSRDDVFIILILPSLVTGLVSRLDHLFLDVLRLILWNRWINVLCVHVHVHQLLFFQYAFCYDVFLPEVGRVQILSLNFFDKRKQFCQLVIILLFTLSTKVFIFAIRLQQALRYHYVSVLEILILSFVRQFCYSFLNLFD